MSISEPLCFKTSAELDVRRFLYAVFLPASQANAAALFVSAGLWHRGKAKQTSPAPSSTSTHLMQSTVTSLPTQDLLRQSRLPNRWSAILGTIRLWNYRLFQIPLIPGSIRRSRPADGLAEGLLKTKKYVVPLAILSPAVAGQHCRGLSDRMTLQSETQCRMSRLSCPRVGAALPLMRESRFEAKSAILVARSAE